MEAESEFENFQAALATMPLSLLWRGYGSAIFLEFGRLKPAGQRRDGSERNATGEFSVGIEWSWRIEDNSSIVCGSWSDGEKWEAAFDLVRNQKLQQITTYARLPELDLQFANNHHVLSFNTTDEQPDWFIIDRRHDAAITLMVDQGKLAIEPPK
ncbi:MAG: hypothetical protein ABJZ55_04355 [Fuerstiella sp.]